MSLRYQVTYYDRDGRPGDCDPDVSERYLLGVPSSLGPGETAFARCLSDPHHDLHISRAGIRPAGDTIDE